MGEFKLIKSKIGKKIARMFFFKQKIWRLITYKSSLFGLFVVKIQKKTKIILEK